jgi:hypothetical protein
MKTKNEILAEIKFTLIKKHNIDALDDALINDCVEMTLKAINYTHSCKSDSEQLDCDRQFINAGTLQGQAMKRCLKCLKYTKAN